MRDIRFGGTSKFDIQLVAGKEAEDRVADLFSGSLKIEVKSESFLWEKTGNICVEYECRGKPSGIAVTEADVWAHELRRSVKGGNEIIGYFLIPVPRLRELCRQAYKAGRRRTGGDDGQSKVVVLRIADLLS